MATPESLKALLLLQIGDNSGGIGTCHKVLVAIQIWRAERKSGKKKKKGARETGGCPNVGGTLTKGPDEWAY